MAPSSYKGPPESKTWVRQTESRLSTLERTDISTVAELKRVKSKLPRVAPNSDISTIAIPTGATGWAKVAADTGPNVDVFAPSGLIKVTYRCLLEGVTSLPTSATAGAAAMGVSLDLAVSSSLTASDYSDLARDGGLHMWSYTASQTNTDRLSAAGDVMYFQTTPGKHTIRSEYYFNRITGSFAINISNRRIIAEGY